MLTMLIPVFLNLACLLGAAPTVHSVKSPLYVGALFSLSEEDGWSRFYGHSALVGAQQAIEDINNRTDVLPSYDLVLIHRDTQAKIPIALDRLYELLYDPPVKVAMLGPMMSFISEVVGAVLKEWHLVEISPASSSPVLDSRSTYPYLFRTVSSAAGFSAAYVEIIRRFGWTKIAILQQPTEPHVGILNELQRLVVPYNISVIGAESFYEDPLEALQRLKKKDVRIIVASFYEELIQIMFCRVYELGMYGSNYVWLLPGFFTSDWWFMTVEGVPCSAAQVKLSSDGFLAVANSKYGILQNDELGLCGRTPAEFRHEMSPIVGYNITATNLSAVATSYDAVWTLALALDELEEDLGRRADSYQYRDEVFAKAAAQRIQRQRFAGMSGTVRFSERGYNLGLLLIKQQVDGKDVLIGTYDSFDKEVALSISEEDIWYYNGGKAPFDSDITRTVTHLQATPRPTMITVCILVAMGTVMSSSFIGFNIWKREHRQIKMSSPKLNNLIAVGILLAYIGVVLLGVDRSMVDETPLLAICKIRSVVIPVAFTLAFGGMFTKMWRVYSIVIVNKTKKKVIKDFHLFGVVGVLLLIDFAILVPWLIVDPIHIAQRTVPVLQTKEDLANYIKRVTLFVTCTSRHDTIWTMTLIIYKTFVVVFGAFLAWSTRNVTFPGLNDSYYVGLSIYNTVICSVVAVPLSLLNASSVGVTYALVSGFLILCITVSLCMLFFPKVIAVYRKNGVVGTISTMTTTAGGTSFATRDPQSLVQSAVN